MGVSGLQTALSLLQKSPKNFSSITFYEASSNVGGVLNHATKDGFLLEYGAQGVLLSRQSFLETIKSLNIENEILIPDSKIGTRYLIINNKCIPLSLNPFPLLKLKLINIFNLYKLIKFFIFNKRTVPNVNDTLYEYVLRNFGQKIADNFLIPFCFGIWGGGAKKLLLRFCFPSFFSQQKTQKTNTPKGLASFAHGMNFLPQKMYEKIQSLCIENHIQLNSLFNQKVSYSQIKEMNFDVIIYAHQPWLENNLSFGNTDKHKNAEKILKEIPTHSLVVVGIGGKKQTNFNYKTGFGVLANKTSKDLLGVLFIHSTYPDHVPKEHFLYRVLLGGDRENDVINLSDDDLFICAKNHLKQINLISGNEDITFQKSIRYEKYIPLGTEYQDQVLCALWQLEALNSGLFFTGNYINGVSVADCIEHAKSTANNVIQYLQEQT